MPLSDVSGNANCDIALKEVDLALGFLTGRKAKPEAIGNRQRDQEEDDLYEMANLFPRTTGLPMIVWVSPRGRARHDAWIKVSLTPGRMDIGHPARRADWSVRAFGRSSAVSVSRPPTFCWRHVTAESAKPRSSLWSETAAIPGLRTLSCESLRMCGHRLGHVAKLPRRPRQSQSLPPDTRVRCKPVEKRPQTGTYDLHVVDTIHIAPSCL